ncbi:hypothetical protein [Epilithonimonas hominis]|uniref:hypothetical protein n=1 Tax=Epilithonimonas hominis TaxID=420404 RepID=UPI0028A16C63|nr:hypothetical protein [Epilithonimonas hominis]
MTTSSPLEKNIKILQRYVNGSIDKKYQNFIYSYSVKYDHLTQGKKKSATEEEIEKFSDKLMHLIRNNPFLKKIVHEIDSPDFLWNSSFIECLTKDERNKYSVFDESEFIKNHSFDELPYLSQIVDYLVYIRYLKDLRTLIPSEKPQKPTNYQFVEPQKKKEHKVKVREEGKEQDFGAKFEEWEIDLLTKCINDSRIFSKTITSETMNEIFFCTLKFPLIIGNRKNKLLAYFFVALNNKSLIVPEWQSLCARKSLFLSYNGVPWNQNNISTAVNDCIEKNPPKDCHIIDKYIKQLKKD